MCVSPIASGRTGCLYNLKTNSNVQFRGNLMKLERDVFVNISSCLKPKMKNLGSEITDYASGCLRKLFRSRELPVSKKVHINPILQDFDQLEAAARTGNYTAKRNLELLKDNNIWVPHSGIVADSGYIRTYHKDAIYRQLDEDVANGRMPKWKADDIKRDLKFGSKNGDLEGVVDADAASHVDADTVISPVTSDGALEETTSNIVDNAADGSVSEGVLDTAFDFFDKILDFFS